MPCGLWVQRTESNRHRPVYGAGELPVLYSAVSPDFHRRRRKQKCRKNESVRSRERSKASPHEKAAVSSVGFL